MGTAMFDIKGHNKLNINSKHDAKDASKDNDIKSKDIKVNQIKNLTIADSKLTGKRLKARKRLLHQRRRFGEWLLFSGYLAPSLVGTLLFFFVPLILLCKTSFQKSSANTDFVGFDNYKRVLSNNAFVLASKNTLTFALWAVPLAVVLALLLALILNSGIPCRSVFRSILLNPMMVPVASVVLIWQVFFSFNGVVNGWFGTLFGADKLEWLECDNAQIVILILFLWKNLGYNMVLFLAALNNIPSEILESAKMDGAGSIRRFFSIKMHYLNSTIFFVGIMSLINSFKIFREVYLLTGDHPFNTLYMLQHFMNNAFTHLDYSKLSAGAMIMLVAMAFIVGALFLAESKFDSDVEE